MIFAPDALRAMKRYSWPGNVRELQNRVKRAVIMASGSRVTAKDLELDTARTSAASSATTLRQAREQVEREMVQQALKRNSGKITSAAAELGISRPTLYELMEKLGIAKERAHYKRQLTIKIILHMQTSKILFRIVTVTLQPRLLPAAPRKPRRRAFLPRPTIISKRATTTKPR